MGQLEDYLAGTPLSEEIAELAKGEPEPAAPPRYEPFAGTVTDDDVQWLRRMRGEPGWPIFRRMVEKVIQERERACIIFSHTDPLGNQEEIAQGWAYVAVLKQVVNQVLDLVEAA